MGFFDAGAACQRFCAPLEASEPLRVRDERHAERFGDRLEGCGPRDRMWVYEVEVSEWGGAHFDQGSCGDVNWNPGQFLHKTIN